MSKLKPDKDMNYKVLISLVKNRELSAPEIQLVMQEIGADITDVIDALISELRNYVDNY